MNIDRRSFLGLLAGSFAAVPVLGLKDLLPLGVTSRGVRPVGDLPIQKIRWTKPMPWPDQAVIVGRALVDVTHECACGWTAHGMFATYSVKEADVKNNRDLVAMLEVKKKNAIMALQDIWNTAKNEPFISHASCPKIVGAYRPPVDNDIY